MNPTCSLLQTLTPETLARLIDHTCLKPHGPRAQIEQLCQEAREHGFAMVAIHPAQIQLCKRLLAGTAVHVGAAVGFPLGQNTPQTKAFEARDAIDQGADELDMVINLRALEAGELSLVQREIRDLVAVCRPARAISKVILETCYLNDEQKRAVCQIAVDEGADFVKTSTGFGPAGAMLSDVRLMRAAVGQRAGVKAAGGIRTLAQVQALLDAGATRIGTSNSVAILAELAHRPHP